MKRINFILNALDGHSYKRIEEFRALGFDICVYGFDRGLSKQYEGIDTKILGVFPNTMPYKKRIVIIYRALRNLFRGSCKDDSDLWYYFGLQMAMFCVFINKNNNYLYEESDMTHLSIKNRFLRGILEYLNKQIIRKSKLAVFTSEGFLQYHFGKEDSYPNNTVVMPNKIHPRVNNYPIIPKHSIDTTRLRFGFVGFIRYQAVYNMAEVITRLYPNHEFHFFGEIQLACDVEKFGTLKERHNIFFHGFFKNPDQLSEVYSNIDVVISTYDVTSTNVLYAEPNKLYESIYFRTPIIVSEGTFLARQVERYRSGWSVNAFDEMSICHMVKDVQKDIKKVTEEMSQIPLKEAIDTNEPLEKKMNQLFINNSHE